jgi:hypothetical protein
MAIGRLAELALASGNLNGVSPSVPPEKLTCWLAGLAGG